MKKFGDRVKERREELNISQDDLAQRLGYKSRSSITRIESNERDLPQKKIYDLAQALGVKPSYLMGWEETTDIETPFSEPITYINLYPPISCGGGMFTDDNIITVISVPTSMLPKHKKDLFAQYANGDSMTGKGINDGDLLIFSREECSSGDIGCFCIDENVSTCKTLKITDKQIILMPANEKYDPIVVDVNDFRCVGT